MSKRVKVIKQKQMRSKIIDETLKQMEKIVDAKLASQKVFTPLLFTVITSVIAFLFVNNLGDDVVEFQLYMVVFCYALICFFIIIKLMFGKNDYKAVEKETKEEFKPHKLSSYCNLSDMSFVERISQYVGHRLTSDELLRVNCLKQKVNEYAFKKKELSKVLAIVMTGTLFLLLICIVAILKAPEILQNMGGNA